MGKTVDLYNLKVNWSQIYDCYVGTCHVFFRGIVCQDQDEFIVRKELTKAVEYKIKCMEEAGEALPHPNARGFKEPISKLETCPTCKQKVVRFDQIKSYTDEKPKAASKEPVDIRI